MLSVRCWTFNVFPFLRSFRLAGSSASPREATSGYGPPTSVPVERSTIARAALPPRNWIDQTQREADAKSIGCLECHKGVEPMHKAEQNVVLAAPIAMAAIPRAASRKNRPTFCRETKSSGTLSILTKLTKTAPAGPLRRTRRTQTFG